MKTIFLIILITLSSGIAFSQIKVCENRLDSARVVKIAKRHHAYWTKNWQSPPSIKLDEQSCRWTVVCWRTHHSDKGECKYTNGCTISDMVTLVIDAKTKRVISKKRTKTSFPNYE
ncbi:MAG: hypothetical protein WC716_11115 [Chitinophagaceae bacterium]|jgi:hypothetical protein